MRENITYTTTFLTSGVYIGDPCYAIKDDLYDAWGHRTGFKDGVISISKTDNNQTSDFVVLSTAYGDGYYASDKPGQYFPVDAGCLCVADINTCDPEKIKEIDTLGSVIMFDEPTLVQVISNYDNGTITFTVKTDLKTLENIRIFTDEDDEQ